MPTVIIFNDQSIHDFYAQIQASLDARFMGGPYHYYPELTDEEAGELEYYSAYAEHACDDLRAIQKGG